MPLSYDRLPHLSSTSKRNMSFSRQTTVVNVFTTLFTVTIISGIQANYAPNWKSLDSRPLPKWYDEAKFGIFIHWGVFSVPSFGPVPAWFWERWVQRQDKDVVDFMKSNYREDFTYADFAPMFQAEFFDPHKWANILKSSGAKYVVLVSKHHEGFTNWPSKYSFNWNSWDVGPKKDLVGELATAIRQYTDIHFGLYHSLFEWFHPLYLQDKQNNFKTDMFVRQKTMPELYEIVERYKPEVVWSDGAAAPDTYWNSTGFLAWLYNDSPVKDTVVTNDRWGNNTPCHHGGYYTCNDRYNPGTLQKHKWENCMTIDRKSWGYDRRSSLDDFLTMDELTEVLASTVSCGGNLLMNVGPTHDGRIVPIYEERLRQMGQWLAVNGEAIYASKPWTHQNDTVTPRVWFTSKMADKAVYAILLDWPEDGTIHLGAVEPTPGTEVTMLGLPKVTLHWTKAPGGGILIKIPTLSVKQVPCQWAWILKFTRAVAASGPSITVSEAQNVIIDL